VASGFSDCVIISKRLADVELTDRIGMVTDNLFTIFAENTTPGFDSVYADSFSNIVSVETHAWYERWVVKRSQLFIIFDYVVKRSYTETCCVPHL
jgi:hypothetical protein